MVFIIFVFAPLPEAPEMCPGCRNDVPSCACICGFCGNLECDGTDCGEAALAAEREHEEAMEAYYESLDCTECEDKGYIEDGPMDVPCPCCQGPDEDQLYEDWRERQWDRWETY